MFCPSHRYPQFESGTSLNASLGDFRSVRTAQGGDISGDVRAFAKLARYVSSLWTRTRMSKLLTHLTDDGRATPVLQEARFTPDSA